MAFVSAKEKSDLELSKKLRRDGVISTAGMPFDASTRAELDALAAAGVYELIQLDDTHQYVRLFNTRLVNEVKGKSTTLPYEKSRLVVQGYNDAGKEEILTQSSTIQHVSQRLILSLAPTLLATQNMGLYFGDITQAYVQSNSELNRLILANLPASERHKHPPNTVMRIFKPLYGIAEAGTHWYATYHAHHLNNLNMETSTYDPCFLVTKKPKDGLETGNTVEPHYKDSGSTLVYEFLLVTCIGASNHRP
ncbi:hypothetical protein K3495_g6656 [Podosphaera aphanis]|nr:hypothetical protein K3495_g6656 [Podosphaera aphanis]